MNQPEARPATPISWGDASATAAAPTWQGPPARRPAARPDFAVPAELGGGTTQQRPDFELPAQALVNPEPPSTGTPEATPEHSAYVAPEPPAYDPAFDEPAPAPEAPSPDYAQPWVQDGTAHTADEVHQVWAEHQTSPEDLSGQAAPVVAAPPAPVATTPPAPIEIAPAETPRTEPEPASDDDSLTLGRARSNSIVLDDMLVSRHHARISADDQGLIIEDLGSRNGTFVNGRRVQTTRLHEGDRIGIGASTFEVRDGWLVSA